MTHKDVIRIKYFDIGDLHPDYEHPLTRPPGYYLTGYEGSPCDKPEPIRCGKFKYQIQGIDTDKFRKECLEEDE